MKKLLIASILGLLPAVAAAHPSLLAHEHPHAVSLLPDLAAMLMAALAVGTGAVFVAAAKRAQK
jgi:hypothetical protein